MRCYDRISLPDGSMRRGICIAVLLMALVPETSGGEALTRTPFAPPSSAAAATMFSEVGSAQSGIVTENAYADPKMWGELYHELVVGAIGTGIAIGDYDGDGRPDLFVVSKTQSNHLFRNLGGFRFEDVTTKAGVAGPAGAWKQGATFADIDNDGRLDLYVCRFGAPNLLYINQGDGTFKEEGQVRGLAVKDASGMAAFCDYDRDGFLDAYLQTNLLSLRTHPNGQPDYLFHNNRDGTFTNVTAAAGIAGDTQGHAVTWWDFDNDDWPDIYVANDFAAPDSLYRNNHDGTFTNVAGKVLPHTPFTSMGADLGDVNNDGRIDLFVADMAATTPRKDLRGMADSRARNQDAVETAGAAPQFQRNALYLNTGAAALQEAAVLAGIDATDWTWSARFEDLDNDGRIDLHVTNGTNREQHNADLVYRMMAAESPAARVQAMRHSPVFAERHLAFRNRGDLEFEEIGRAWGLDQTGVSFGAAFGDLDGDGDLDLVYSNYEKGATVLRNDSDSGQRLIVDLRGTASNRFGVGATVKIETASGIQVRQLVLARGYLSSSEPAVHFGLGTDKRVRQLTVTWPSGCVQTLSDVPGGGRITLTEPVAAESVEKRGRSVPTLFVEQQGGIEPPLTLRDSSVDETSEQPLLPFRFNRRGPSVAVADFNADGWPDLAFGGTTHDARRIGWGGAEGGLRANGGFAFPVNDRVNDGPLAAFDANGDGAIDLLVTEGGVGLPAGDAGYQPTLWVNQGNGSFAAAAPGTLPPFTDCAGAVVVGDFDHVGGPDVFIGGRVVPGEYPAVPRSALWSNQAGKFSDITATAAPALAEIGLVTAALASDVDGDGWLDLLLTAEWGGVCYFHNREGNGFDDWSERAGFASAGTGLWRSLATADFNGDHRPDFVAGNVGLNTTYSASAAEPALLYYGEFQDDGLPQIIEARHDGPRIVPRRSRGELAAAIPAIRKRFPKNDDFAAASLEEIVGAQRLAAARRFAATELRSGVFLSQPDGTYVFEPLPRIVQISTAEGIATGDFDGDELADIYVVQNSFSPVPSIGRFDGGLSQLLRGNGRGGFKPIPPHESGLVVTGDAKAVGVLDLDRDGRPDFVVTRNGAPAVMFKNRRQQGNERSQ